MFWSKYVKINRFRSCFTKAQASKVDQKQLAELDAKLAKLNEHQDQQLGACRRQNEAVAIANCIVFESSWHQLASLEIP